MRSGSICRWLAPGFAAALASCAGSERSQPIDPSPGAPAPIVTTARSGLEVHWWLARDTDDAVAARLSEYVEPPLPRDEALRRRWRDAGLRLVRAPAGALPQLQQDLPAMHLRRREWIGWAPRWIEIFSGRRAGGAAPLIVEGRRQRFDAGTLRVLLRAWPEPESADHSKTSIRIELAVQLHQERAPTAIEMLERPRIIPEQEQGFVFQSLTLETTIEDGFLYLVTTEAPDQEWTTRRTASMSPEQTGNDESSTPIAREEGEGEPSQLQSPATDAAPGPTMFGPPVDRPMTIGQAMMTASDPESPLGAGKVVIAILPRAPEKFQLLPRFEPSQ